jgi:hypothetical protein
VNIGLLMISDENDILAEVLAGHCEIVDAFYVLDGTAPNKTSRKICMSFPKCLGYATDSELPRPPYPEGTTCGYRQFPYEMACAEHGSDHWFLELHGDEVWTFDPRDLPAEHPEADGFIFPLPVYFPREPWDDDVPPLEQLKWHLGPGWPELRMFHGGPEVNFSVEQHFNTQPHGINKVVRVDKPIKHLLFRAPEHQRQRAARHERTGYDPDNYKHITERDEVIWSDEMIAHWQTQACWRDLARDE